MWGRVLAGALDLLFPARCGACGAYGDLLCPSCREALPRALPPRCLRCWDKGPPIAGAAPPRSSPAAPSSGAIQGEVCLACQEAPPAFQGARAPYRYEGPVRQLLRAYKYQLVAALAEPLADLLAQYLCREPLPGGACDLLVPVPLHPRRQRERGYNQAALLARDLSQRLGIPWEEGALRRVKAGQPQARSATLEERRRNVRGAFAAEPQRVAGRRLLLIDDIMTSGATLDACARALREAGAASVWALTFARD